MITRFLTLFAALCLISAVAFADSAADIQHRMAQRLAAIDGFKAQEVIGENNRGYIEVRKSAPGADSLVTDENRDREAVYALIAQKTSASPDAVARARAKQIAANSRSGVWLQDDSGKWYKK